MARADDRWTVQKLNGLAFLEWLVLVLVLHLTVVAARGDGGGGGQGRAEHGRSVVPCAARHFLTLIDGVRVRSRVGNLSHVCDDSMQGAH
jgi:hypothetical protein